MRKIFSNCKTESITCKGRRTRFAEVIKFTSPCKGLWIENSMSTNLTRFFMILKWRIIRNRLKNSSSKCGSNANRTRWGLILKRFYADQRNSMWISNGSIAASSKQRQATKTMLKWAKSVKESTRCAQLRNQARYDSATPSKSRLSTWRESHCSKLILRSKLLNSRCLSRFNLNLRHKLQDHRRESIWSCKKRTDDLRRTDFTNRSSSVKDRTKWLHCSRKCRIIPMFFRATLPMCPWLLTPKQIRRPRLKMIKCQVVFSKACSNQRSKRV